MRDAPSSLTPHHCCCNFDINVDVNFEVNFEVNFDVRFDINFAHVHYSTVNN